GVSDLRGPDGGRVVGRRLHVVSYAFSFGDDGSERVFHAVCSVRLGDVAEHHDSGEHEGHRVDFVLASILGSASVDGLEQGDLIAEVGDGGGAALADDLEREAGVLPDATHAGGIGQLADLLDGRVALLELDAGVEVLVVLADDDEVDVLVAGADAWVAFGGAQAGIEVEHLAEGDVDGAKATAARCSDRALDGDLVGADGVKDFFRKDGAVLLGGVEAGFAVIPIKGDAGGLEDADGGVHDLWADAVAGDNGYAMRHSDWCFSEQ